ncbi:MADS-box transcription factor 23-like [Cannabis sativa]|uniref:MADS-box transcription factor 23-like n=1 Tax=Cannabis sativa TaxID=3483 RepID=UPI0029CAA677|nr:MADS-box transcription factor 23-like [Cannabis sativa]
MKRKIAIEKIDDKQRRLVSFSKRKSGLFNKAKQLSHLTGAQIAVIILSETGRPYVQASPTPSSFESLIAPFVSSSPSTSTTEATHEMTSSTTETETSTTQGEDVFNLNDSLRYLLEFDVENCNDLKELEAMKKKLEETRKRTAVALDLSVAEYLLSD